MDCKKIGIYIQNKRKAAGLTQNELGELLGITDKAVSKWECGAALPDVTLFNELSKILEIDVSELLNGQDNNKLSSDKKKNILIYRLIIGILGLFVLVIFLGNFFIHNYNKVHVYDLVSERDSFYVEGKLIDVNDDTYFAISTINYESGANEFSTFNIFDFEYEIIYLDNVLYKYGNIDSNVFSKEEKIEKEFLEVLDEIKIFTKFSKNINDFDDASLILEIKILNSNNQIKSYDIPLKIRK